MKRRTRWALGAAFTLVVGAGTAVAWWSLAPRHAPPGQSKFVELDHSGFDELRGAFNAAADRTRIVALLSPT